MALKAKKQKPIKPGLFKITDNNRLGYLIGSKCYECGEIFYPKRSICPNCFSEKIDELPLNRKGRLYTYTIARTTMPGSIVDPPFISGIIEIEMPPSKLRIVSLVTGFDLNEVKIGSEVELYFFSADAMVC